MLPIPCRPTGRPTRAVPPLPVGLRQIRSARQRDRPGDRWIKPSRCFPNKIPSARLMSANAPALNRFPRGGPPALALLHCAAMACAAPGDGVAPCADRVGPFPYTDGVAHGGWAAQGEEASSQGSYLARYLAWYLASCLALLTDTVDWPSCRAPLGDGLGHRRTPAVAFFPAQGPPRPAGLARPGAKAPRIGRCYGLTVSYASAPGPRGAAASRSWPTRRNQRPRPRVALRALGLGLGLGLAQGLP